MAHTLYRRGSGPRFLVRDILVNLLVSALLILGPVNSSSFDTSTNTPYAVGCFSAGDYCVSVPITGAKTNTSLTDSVFTTLSTSYTANNSVTPTCSACSPNPASQMGSIAFSTVSGAIDATGMEAPARATNSLTLSVLFPQSQVLLSQLIQKYLRLHKRLLKILVHTPLC